MTESNEKYHILFESADDAIFLMDKENFIDCNNATLKLFNYKREEIINQPPFLFSPPFQPDGRDSKSKALELIQRAYNGESLQFEWLHTKKTGENFWCEVRLNRFKVGDNMFLLAIVRDITERKKNLTKIQLFANALEHINEAVSITNVENRFVYVNKKFCELYGYTKEDLIGQDAKILRVDDEDKEKLQDIFNNTLKGGWKGELWNKRKNGEKILIKLTSSPVFDEYGMLIAAIHVAYDITAEKEKLFKIQYDAERIKILFEYAPDPIFVIDSEGKLVEANKACENLTGIKKESEIGKKLFDLFPFDRKNKYKLNKLFYKALQGIPSGPDEIELNLKSGNTLAIEVFTHPISLEGKIIILSTARDITERKKLLKELTNAKERADLASKLKTLFYASMSHEIRTPINAILGFIEVIKDIYYEKADDEVKNYFDILENNSRNLLNIISQILDFSRLESGTIKFEPKLVLLNEELIKAKESLSLLANKKSLDISLDLPEEKVTVFADLNAVQSIITNILSNAIKYSDSGTIKVRLRKSYGFGIIEVQDQGIGMSEEFIKMAFNEFSRDPIVAKMKEGTGLGLAITKRYVEMNNGKILIHSTLGKGTTVIVRLPLHREL